MLNQENTKENKNKDSSHYIMTVQILSKNFKIIEFKLYELENINQDETQQLNLIYLSIQ